MPLILLGGYTGSGKTEILAHLQSLGQQVLNLEKIASHSGSVFGHIPHAKVSGSYAFHKMLANIWQKLDLSHYVYCEAKSPTIGKVQIPSWLFRLMQEADVVWLDTSREIRLQRLLSTYGHIDSLSFTQALARLSHNVDGNMLQQIYTCFESGKRDTAFSLLMEYYDKAIYYDKMRYKITGKISISEWVPENHATEIVTLLQKGLHHED